MTSMLHQRGNIVLTFTFLLPVIISLMAVTLFFSMCSQVVIRAGQASDAAVVACAYQQHIQPPLLQKFLDYYRPKFVFNAVLSVPTLTAQQGCQISSQYQFKPIMQAALPRRATEDANLYSNSHSGSKLMLNSTIKPVDISLILDISGSMSYQLPTLKRIITSLISDIDPDHNQVRFSVVPFESGVSIKDAPWYRASKNSPTCVDGLSYNGKNMDAYRTVRDLNVPPKRLKIKGRKVDSWLNDCSPSATLLPLTSDLNRVKHHVNNLVSSGGTASYQGLIWGVRTLTSVWQRAWQVKPVQSDQLTQRLVLFTDGQDGGFVLDSLINSGLCRVIREDLNIEMVFIGFGVYSSRIAQFRQCTGSSDRVYDAKNTADLKTYFKAAFEGGKTARIVLSG